MRVTIIGNCQSAGLASCLATMAPQLDLRVSRPVDADALIRLLDECDQLLLQGEAPALPPALAARVLRWPRLTFAAFHPDAVYAQLGGRVVRSGIGEYHSALALFAARAGLTVAQAMRLFTARVFERLGYCHLWDGARRALLAEGETVGLKLEPMFEGWAAQGRFMHLPNHPCLPVVADVARALLAQMDITPVETKPERFLTDALARSMIWPLYPEIALRLGLDGAYSFKLASTFTSGVERAEVIGLDTMLERSLLALTGIDAGALTCARLDRPAWQALAADVPALVATPLPRAAGGNPYRGLPAHQYWRQAMEETPAEAVDPVVAAPFRITPRTAIATAGSCFAQHIARTLGSSGFNHMVVETPPPALSPAQIEAGHWGSFSARYGNIYTARQMVQLAERAEGRFEPEDVAWQRPDGAWVDPFRPQIDPVGHVSRSAVEKARDLHLQAVRRMLRQVDVFVFTLGLTESWRARADGAVFPLAPGVMAGTMDPAAYEFVNFTTAEILADLRAFRAALRAVNPGANLVLTVSPVPLVATYEARHVLVSTIASKSILRAAAEEYCREDRDAWYFPSYEIVTGQHARGTAFGPDLREVTEATVARVMALFLHHATHESKPAKAPDEAPTIPDPETTALFKVLCDEERLAG